MDNRLEFECVRCGARCIGNPGRHNICVRCGDYPGHSLDKTKEYYRQTLRDIQLSMRRDRLEFKAGLISRRSLQSLTRLMQAWIHGIFCENLGIPS